MHSTIKQIEKGICAPQGFKAGGLHCGIAKSLEKKDLGLIASELPCSVAGVFTKNKVQAAPITVTKRHIANGRAQAIIVNSGNANACTIDGEDVASKMCALTAEALGIPIDDVVVASTGVIGQPLNIQPVDANIGRLSDSLSCDGGDDCARSIMTTDLVKKEIAVSFELAGKIVKIGGIAKGSGMIHPNMGTMLTFLSTDVDISSFMLDKALRIVVNDTYNMISVDGDTSTNDTAVILANGMAGNPKIEDEGEEFRGFVLALMYVCIYMARMVARDGEGATKLLECQVNGAKDEENARLLAKSVLSSNLFKAAMFGADANWGRVLCAMGYSGADFDPKTVSVAFGSAAGSVTVCKDGCAVSFSEETAKKILSEENIEIKIDLAGGEGTAVGWGCDLTYDYVKINGDYRS